MKNAVLLLLVYSAVVTVFLIAYFLPIRQALGRLFGGMNFAQRFILAFAFFTIVAVVGVFVLLLLLDISVSTNLGQVGDFVGGLLNPILSFLALIAIVSSISLQEKELSSTIESLRSQELIFKTQNFESSFFNLLSMQRERRSEQKSDVDGKIVSSYSYIADLIYDERKKINADAAGWRKSLSAAKTALEDMDARDSSIMLLEQFSILTKMIENARMSGEQVKYYMTLAYSSLDANEVLVLVNYSVYRKRVRRMLKQNLSINVTPSYFIASVLSAYYGCD